MRKKVFFRLFRIDAKRRNLKRNENETKRKKDAKKRKLPSFLLRSDMKLNRREKSVFFSPVFAPEAKRKLNEAKTKRKRRENL
jgi:hypothetical protein